MIHHLAGLGIGWTVILVIALMLVTGLFFLRPGKAVRDQERLRRRELRRSLIALRDELMVARPRLNAALEDGVFWPADYQLPDEAWREHQTVLAQEKAFDGAREAAMVAYRAANFLNGKLAEAYKAARINPGTPNKYAPLGTLAVNVQIAKDRNVEAVVKLDAAVAVLDRQP